MCRNASRSADFLEPRCCTGVGVATAGRPLHPPQPLRPLSSPAVRRGFVFRRSQQLRQLGDGRRDRSRLILGHEITRVSNLRREVHIRHSERVSVANDVACRDIPRLSKAAGSGACRSSKVVFHLPADTMRIDVPAVHVEQRRGCRRISVPVIAIDPVDRITAIHGVDVVAIDIELGVSGRRKVVHVFRHWLISVASVIARAVALRGAESIRAISPKILPGESVSST
jgi:hypothetical protein